jgi:hypothetical protein
LREKLCREENDVGKETKNHPRATEENFHCCGLEKASTEEKKSINRIDMMCIVILNTKEGEMGVCR